MGKTLFDKLWDRHVVESQSGVDILYIDQHFIHEVTTPQAFGGMAQRGVRVRRPDRTVATPDHNVPTLDQHLPIKEKLSRTQVETLHRNCEEHGIEIYPLGHANHGIVHIIGPELGITRPGMTIVCGDSHTSTHGAFGCIAFGIGTSQVEQVLTTQCLVVSRPRTMRITIDGELTQGVHSKDVILHIIAQLGTAGGTGYFVEYAGSAIRAMSMEQRMTICNMSIEMGARGGMIAPDETTYEYMRGREFAPAGAEWERSLAFWQTLYSDADATFDSEINIKAEDIRPMVTYGTNPGQGVAIDRPVPEATAKSLEYMGIESGQSMLGRRIQNVFIGSCTNGRIEDLRIVADYVKGKQKADHVRAWIVPGSKRVEMMAREEGISEVLSAAGFELREPGCSACLGMNEDKIPAGEYCVSTSNRNFEGRQGPGARTILASPLTAAAAAIHGEIVDVSRLDN